jgi:hypothetical protein
MADERQQPPHESELSTGGASPGGDPDYHLHSELGEEAKRLAAHPREEVHRLGDELREGESEATPLLAMSGVAIWVGLLVAGVIVLVFVVSLLAS